MSARSDLLINLADASLAYDSYGINFPPGLAAEFLHLDSRPTLYAAPWGADSSFCFSEEVVQEKSYTPIKIGTIQRRLTEMTRTIVNLFLLNIRESSLLSR